MPSPIDIENFRSDPIGPLYRRFQEREHAQALLNGEFRFKNLLYYRELDDPTRRDELEGTSHIDSLGTRLKLEKDGKTVAEGKLTSDIAVGLKRPDRYFISCFSTEIKESHRAWGPWVVKLNDPKMLFRQMSEGCGRDAALIWSDVSYYDGPSGPGLIGADDIWRRKRQEFSQECEFRLGLFLDRESDQNAICKVNTDIFAGEAELIHDSG